MDRQSNDHEQRFISLGDLSVGEGEREQIRRWRCGGIVGLGT